MCSLGWPLALDHGTAIALNWSIMIASITGIVNYVSLIFVLKRLNRIQRTL